MERLGISPGVKNVAECFEKEKSMKSGGIGGANTKTGLAFEVEKDLPTFISEQKGYDVIGNDLDTKLFRDGTLKKIGTKLRKPNEQFRWQVLYKNEEVAQIFQQEGLYRYFAEIEGYNFLNYISRKIKPDDSIFVMDNNTVFIIEKKTQNVEGSVDEKLQTADFKLKQYKKLFAPLNKEVKYYYILDSWFEQAKYKDVRNYIISVGCEYRYDYIPLKVLGLPVPEVENE